GAREEGRTDWRNAWWRFPGRAMWASARQSLRVEILEHGRKRLADRLRMLPVPDFLADLFGLEHAGIAQHPKVMRHRGTRKRGRRDDLSDVEPLAGLEHQHDPLPVRIAERNEHPRRPAPGAGNCAGITRTHAVASGARRRSK